VNPSAAPALTPPEFTGMTLGSTADFWIPLHAIDRIRPNPKIWKESFSSWLLIAGRLRPDVPLAQSQAELDLLHRQLLAEQIAVSELRSRRACSGSCAKAIWCCARLQLACTADCATHMSCR
jgi:hypothetical protein